jgi:CheY-like chemotaxis protein
MVKDAIVLGLRTADGRKPRVALVGGTPAGAMVAGVLMEHFGCAPVAARSGAEIMALIADRQGVDVVVIDIDAGDTQSLLASQLIGTVGSRGAPPIVALGDPRAGGADAARFVRFAGTVAKPYSPRELFGALRQALAAPVAVVAGTA